LRIIIIINIDKESKYLITSTNLLIVNKVPLVDKPILALGNSFLAI